MNFNNQSLQSYVGTTINGVFLEKVLIERIYLRYFVPSSNKCPIDSEFAEWVFFVGIYKAKDSYYLFLDSNDQSSYAADLIDNNTFPNTGIVNISEDIAICLSEKLSELGKEYFEYSFKVLSKLLHTLISSINCEITFSPLLTVNGFFDKTFKEIVIANNTSQLAMIIALIHEYTHFLLDSKELPPQTIGEYSNNDEEYICNLVAFKFIVLLLDPECIKHIIKNGLTKLSDILPNDQCLSDMYCFFPHRIWNLSPEEYFLINNMICPEICPEQQNKLRGTIDSLFDKMMETFDSQTDIDTKQNMEFVQTGLVELSLDDNQILFETIMNEISPMFPTEDYYED